MFQRSSTFSSMFFILFWFKVLTKITEVFLTVAVWLIKKTVKLLLLILDFVIEKTKIGIENIIKNRQSLD